MHTSHPTPRKEPMASMTRAQRRAERATRRRVRKSRARLQQEQRRAQSSLRALEQALVDLGRPETLAVAVEWRLKAPAKRLGTILGLMCPTVCRCRTSHALTQVRVWDQHLPSRSLGALPQQQWGRQLPPRGQDLCATRWPPVEATSAATRSRWPWTGVGDDRVFKTAGQPLGLGGGDREREAGRPGGLWGAPPGPGGARPARPRPADVAAGHAGPDLGRPAAAGSAAAPASGRGRSLVRGLEDDGACSRPPARQVAGGGEAHPRLPPAGWAPDNRPGPPDL